MASRLLVVVVWALAGCLPPLPPRADNVIDVRYRTPAAQSTPTDLYRAIGSRSLAVTSRCKMTPTDSEAFAIRAERCGSLSAWYWGIARLMLEQANSPRYAAPIRQDDRLRWIDLPGDRCD